jgi:hypothetical protein
MNYLALLLVVVVGVAAGNLLSDWIGAELAAYRVKQAVDEHGKSARSAPARSDDKSLLKSFSPEQLLRRQQEEAREQRRRDQDGVRLARACEQWRNADAQLRTETTGAEAKKHCALYDRYVNDGVLPGKR